MELRETTKHSFLHLTDNNIMDWSNRKLEMWFKTIFSLGLLVCFKLIRIFVFSVFVIILETLFIFLSSNCLSFSHPLEGNRHNWTWIKCHHVRSPWRWGLPDRPGRGRATQAVRACTSAWCRWRRSIRRRMRWRWCRSSSESFDSAIGRNGA